ncbi:hypothetical protein EJ08DRAFT_44980 [Tothia fuscella]|uniref:Uncharacterized protein n=1 Tax=Tothia fuscella TaxID=1048955 RepID=A0A9P4NFR3_9PEZI|nr:hypothetical protein EJ08DRAFT_44980 [Tothia fuscella]
MASTTSALLVNAGVVRGFFGLPQELRDSIYDIVFQDSCPYDISKPTEFNDIIRIFQVNKQLSTEAQHIFFSRHYQRMQITCVNPRSLRSFLRSVGNRSRHPHGRTRIAWSYRWDTTTAMSARDRYLYVEDIYRLTHACRRLRDSRTEMEFTIPVTGTLLIMDGIRGVDSLNRRYETLQLIRLPHFIPVGRVVVMLGNLTRLAPYLGIAQKKS